MIRYDLKCENDHRFESWFASSNAFDALKAAGQVTCAVCGSNTVEKALMAPPRARAEKPLSTRTPQQDAIEKLRKEVEANSEDVGLRFATEARAMHDGDVPVRQIHGQAKPDEAKKLIEDGVPVLPLPFGPRQKVN